MSCLTLRSRVGDSIGPRKYLETTMFVACCDQKDGISTSRCSNTTSPCSLPINATLDSHSISSNGSVPSVVKNRGNSKPGWAGISGVKLAGGSTASVSRAAPLGIEQLLPTRDTDTCHEACGGTSVRWCHPESNTNDLSHGFGLDTTVVCGVTASVATTLDRRCIGRRRPSRMDPTTVKISPKNDPKSMRQATRNFDGGAPSQVRLLWAQIS